MRYFEDLEVGLVEAGLEQTVDRDEMLEFARKFDPWPFHVDEDAAAASPYGGLIASGAYTLSLLFRSIHALNDRADRVAAILGGLEWKLRFLAPVRPGDRLRHRLCIVEKRLSSRPGRGVVTAEHELVNQDDDQALSAQVVLLYATDPSGGSASS